MIPLWMFPMAIATGNICAETIRTGPDGNHAAGRLALQAGIPAGVLNVVHGGEDVVNAICDHPDIKAISFVGSSRVGTHVYNRQPGRQTGAMHDGAKNHAIVLPDANKEQALNQLTGAASARSRPALHGLERGSAGG
jgi:malonate-semialdehyde dehydrogenase (acetylating)/methylmalonate-semialdehyde dehydrogenase